MPRGRRYAGANTLIGFVYNDTITPKRGLSGVPFALGFGSLAESLYCRGWSLNLARRSFQTSARFGRPMRGGGICPPSTSAVAISNTGCTERPMVWTISTLRGAIL